MDQVVLQVISTSPETRDLYEKKFHEVGFQNILLAKDCNEAFKQMENESTPDVVLCILPLYDGPHCSPSLVEKVCKSRINPIPYFILCPPDDTGFENLIKIVQWRNFDYLFPSASEHFFKYLTMRVKMIIHIRELESIMGGKEGEATILFADIQGYTKAQETRLELAVKLNRVLSLGYEIITEDHRGFIMPYIGDAVMAFFGKPRINDPTEALFEALSAAISIKRRLQQHPIKLMIRMVKKGYFDFVIVE